jgi:hypothetical protein
MNADNALIRLRRGDSINCVTPEGVQFQIQVKLDKYIGLPWYRTRPAYEHCGLTHYSRLSDRHMLEWLGNVTVCELTLSDRSEESK